MAPRSFPPSHFARLAGVPSLSPWLSMLRPTPVVGTRQTWPKDEVCKLPDPDPLFVKLVYYTPDGKPSWEKRIPIGEDMPSQQESLLAEARAWVAKKRQRSIYVLHTPKKD